MSRCGWHKCTEKLPKDNEIVLVTVPPHFDEERDGRKEKKKVNEMTLKEIVEQVKKEKVRITVVITPDEYGRVSQHLEVEPWESFEMKCPYGK